MKHRLLVIAFLLIAQTSFLTGCAALVGGAAGAAVYDAVEDEEEEGD